MASKNLTFQNNLVTIMQLITSANGYHNTVRKVTKKFLDITKVSSFPAISILRGPEKFEPADESVNLWNVRASFSIIGYIRSAADNQDEGKLNDVGAELIEDIEEALLQNIATIGDEAKLVIIAGTDAVLSDHLNYGHVSVYVVIDYYHEADV